MLSVKPNENSKEETRFDKRRTTLKKKRELEARARGLSWDLGRRMGRHARSYFLLSSLTKCCDDSTKYREASCNHRETCEKKGANITDGK